MSSGFSLNDFAADAVPPRGVSNAFAEPMRSSSFVVNTLTDHDDGACDATDCTLREAVKYAPAGSVITFILTGTITLTQGEIPVAKNLTITAPASAPGITVSGNNLSRIFYIGSGTVAFFNLTLSKGNGVGSTGSSIGGAIYINAGAVTVTSCTFSGNSADTGGGIYIGSANMTPGTLNLSDSIVAGNTATTAAPDIIGAVTSGDYNLVQNTSGATLAGTHNITGQDPKLDALKNNGGPTATMALLSGSPAIDAGDPSFNIVAAPFDQRGGGYARKVGGAIDFGAFEVQLAPTAATVSVSGRIIMQSGRGIRNVVVTMTDMQGNVRTATSTGFGY